MQLPRTRRRRVLIVLVVLLALYAGLGFWVVPRVARTQITARAAEQLDREVRLERVRFNPFTLRASLEGLSVLQPDGERLAGLRSGSINFDPWESLFTWQWSLGEVQLEQPFFRLEIAPDGTLNIADLLGRESPDNEEQSLPKVRVKAFAVRDGQVQVVDRSAPEDPFETTVEPINFALQNFSTAPDASGAYRLTGQTEYGATFEWTGRLSAVPVLSEGEVKFGRWELPRYMPILRRWIAGEVTGGTVDLTARYRVSFGSQREVRLSAVELAMNGLMLKLPHRGAPSVHLAQLTVEMPEAQLLQQTASLERVALDGLEVFLERQPDGSFDLAQFARIAPPTTGGAPAAASTSTAIEGRSAPSVVLNMFELRSSTVTFVDRTVPETAEVSLSGLAVTARGLSTQLDKPVAIDGQARLGEAAGELRWQGEFTPQPLSATVEVNLQGVALATATPYLRPFAAITLAGGALSAEGKVRIASSESAGNVQVGWEGDLGIAGLQAQTADGGERLLAWEQLQVSDSIAQLQPLRVTAREVRLQRPTFAITRAPDGQLNALSVLPQDEQPAADDMTPADPAPSGDSAPPFEVQIDLFALEGGTVNWLDQSMTPAFETALADWNLTLENVSSTAEGIAALKTTANVGGAPFTLQGGVNLFGDSPLSGSELQAQLQPVPMKLLEPYIVRYLGFQVQQGRLQGDFAYQIGGDEIRGTNRVILDAFFLGDPVPSPEAIKAPIKLGLAVLRNRQNQIELNVPVSGKLSSPEFSLAATIQSAFSNILVRAATAPFSILGSIFGGGGQVDLSQIGFDAGAAELSDQARSTLDAIARALSERPMLKLRLEPAPAPEADRAALIDRQLALLMQAERERLAAIAENPVAVNITEEQALMSLYRQRIAGPAAVASPSAEPVGDKAVEQTAAKEDPSWIVRVFRRVFVSDDQTAAEVESRPTPVEDRAVDGAQAAEPTIDEVREAVRETIQLPPDAVENLARARADAVVQVLTGTGVPESRITIAAPVAPPEDGRPIIRFGLDEAAPAQAATNG